MRAALEVWFVRLRVLAAVAIVWGGLFVLLDSTLLPVGSRRPATILIGYGGLIPALAMFAVVVGGAAVACFLVPRRDPRTVLLVVGLSLAAWAGARGNMDDWLLARHPVAGPASADAYWPLLSEYTFMLVLLGAAVVVAESVSAGRRATEVADATARAENTARPEARSTRSPTREVGVAPLAVPGAARRSGLITQLFGDGSSAWREGLLALLTTSAVGAAGLLLLSGPIVGRTLRGQVYFATLVGFVFGVIVARQVCRRATPAWFWAAPILTGVAGVLFAALFPGRLLGPEYGQLNILPATGLVRPLPVELLGVGLTAVCWGLFLAPGRDERDAGRS